LRKNVCTDQDVKNFKTRFSIPQKKILIGTAARLVPVKNITFLIDCASEVIKKNPNLHFIIAGDGNEKNRLIEKVKNKNLELFFTFTGFIKNLDPFYRMIDLFVLSSKNEGSPVAIIEALSNGIPVVSTDVGGVSDLFPDDLKHLLSESGNIKQMTANILTVAQDLPFYKEHFKSYKSLIFEKYHYQRLVNDIKNLYQELVFS